MHLTLQQGNALRLFIAAMGCADLPTMDNTVIERVDKDNTVVSCVNSRERSHLVCRDKVWIGEIRNCSSDQGIKFFNLS